MKTVLLTNGQQRKTLAAVRSLGRRGINVIVGEETMLNPAAFSKYCKRALVYPSPKKFPEKFIKWLLDTVIKYNCDIIFPMDDDVLEIVMNNYEELQGLCSIPVPERKYYLKASDKGKSVSLAEEAGINCPKTYYVSEEISIEEMAENIKFPVVIKPRQSSGSRGIRVANSKEELIKEYYNINLEHPSPIIQEKIGTGIRYDVCMLYDYNHKLKAAFVQKELRHFPLEMGPSTIQEGIISQKLVDLARSIMDKLNWTGIVELEFMQDSNDGELKFMEINPRFWGSLEAAILSGVDFPWLLYKLTCKQEIEDCFNYEEGIKCRWLLPGDILHFIMDKNRWKMEPPFLAGKKHKIYDDMLSKEDPLPVLGFILACFKYFFDLNMWRFMFKR